MKIEKLFTANREGQPFILKGIVNLILAAGAGIIMIPFLYLISTSLKDRDQMRQIPPPLIPIAAVTANINGTEEPLYEVTFDGQTRQMALVKNRPGGKGLFVDPAAPESEPLELVIAEQKELTRVELHFENYPEALRQMKFGRVLVNTLLVTFIGMVGMLFSSSLVAYGFSRFRAPWLNILFILLLSTIMLPSQVRLLPTYVFFNKLGWVDTLLPLIVPQFFANAYDVFLLRQFFMTIPLELDDAAKIDGASPMQTLLYIILPQARPALASVAIFHFLYAWNDFYEPLIYLHNPENWTLAVGLQTFNALYAVNTNYIMAASVVMVVPPIILYFLAQKIFTQGVVFTGIK
ncbi:MAG TPA: carbohydrate ABC transporter permease [Anaerolineales bacterium]|nr:carbohydrate ABC transporter permease [Anaerolineales bacterium]